MAVSLKSPKAEELAREVARAWSCRIACPMSTLRQLGSLPILRPGEELGKVVVDAGHSEVRLAAQGPAQVGARVTDAGSRLSGLRNERGGWLLRLRYFP